MTVVAINLTFARPPLCSQPRVTWTTRIYHILRPISPMSTFEFIAPICKTAGQSRMSAHQRRLAQRLFRGFLRDGQGGGNPINWIERPSPCEPRVARTV